MKKLILILALFFLSLSIKAQIVVPLTLPDNCNVSTGIKEIKGEGTSNFSIYPNPNEGVFTIYLSLDKKIEEIEITIYNSTGKECFTQPVYCDAKKMVKQIDISGLPSGVYLIKILSDKYELSSSFIIQN